MIIAPDVVIAVCTATGLAGSVAGWFGKHYTLKSKNGNGHLTKADHEALCSQVKDRLVRGDKQFESIDRKLDNITGILMKRKN